ncbi:preprotein translocase subunit SECE1 [Brachypodium distachyon]|uniref:Preprotein translocase subunit SECE1 n=1 Tax=Brachypodium distachyon TaxID=15368 RepID=A0A0Q3FAN7_BRADI|nr:preprotein translocase subunit SECE1 [Brachypodium distachyon]KQJ96862.1 hypothetical protein BRADI_3g27506v3 [Brachypodium distachyon]KQJ96863.1 hypothetical protein BRADI_3g27506v3 [Brachypodium distachyon]KQJ96864.1 hypothetical protein BRADI_3g27506v3 [Brachypodium distachyon]PNT67442.1 hypothetical protein BRADI_3g27506v3 [Brachypodium distachyon]|eukprot:XP_014755412.1 preprotein translocase subunit SECE1 [Brachypodium distachyon]
MATTPFCRPVQSHCASLPLHRRLSCLFAPARSSPTARPSLSTLGSPALSFCRSISVRRRLAAASKDTASDKGQEQEPSMAAGEALKSGVDETASGEKTPEEVAAELKELMRARKEAEVAAGSTGAGAGWWDGVVQEMSEIEWPAPGKVLGTTGVVLGIIAGSTAALLSVNAILAELSDRVFAGRGLQDFF